MLRAIAIDDEPIALEVIRQLSSKVSFLDVTHYYTNAFDAIPELQKNNTDLLFLDIKMPDISGTEFLRSFAKPPMVIFTTGHSEHAVQSFELDAIDYLLKPFSLPRFLKACNKALERIEMSRLLNSHAAGDIFIKSGNEQVRLDRDKLLYVESKGNYLEFVGQGQKIISRLTMSEALELLPPPAFIRVHRSYIVARKKISKIDRFHVWIDQITLPVSAAYSEGLEKIIMGAK